MAPAGNGDHNAESSSGSEDEYAQAQPQFNPDLSMPGSRKQMYTVLVTGFGPFRGHEVNASWESVKELAKMKITHNVNLITEQIPVCYDKVKSVIPALWEDYKPTLVVHVGVSSLASELTVETIAHNSGYKRPDVEDRYPEAQCCQRDGADCLRTELDVSAICDEVNQSACLIMAVPSCDAGRYLCEFSFYNSLRIDSQRTIFLHVPSLNEPYSAKEIADGLRSAIISMLKQLDVFHPLSLTDEQTQHMGQILHREFVQ